MPDSAENRTKSINEITKFSLVVNLLLSGVKFLAGIIGHSNVVVADAIHSLSDCFTDLAVLWGAKYWDKPPDEDHPHGHQRLEIVLTMLIAASLLIVAGGMLYGSISELRSQKVGPKLGIIAGLASLASIIVKEYVYRKTMRYAKKYKSQVLVANAWHHRSDAISSIPAAIAATAAAFSPDWYFLDDVGAVVVSLLIVVAAYKIGRPAFNQLIDAGASNDIIHEMSTIINNVPEVKGVHKIRTRYIGSSSLSVDMHLVVDGKMTVEEGHAISDNVHQQIYDNIDSVVDIVIHIEPDSLNV